jgi:hypothetical protein
MDRENALPAAGAAGKHEDTRVGIGRGGREDSGARPVGLVPSAGAFAGVVDRGAGQQRQQEYDYKQHGEFLRAKTHGRD